MTEFVIREWGDAWHVRSDDGTTTTAGFLDALSWAAGALEPGGAPISIRWGEPIPEGEWP
ncbi:hypothetical protein LITTLEE_162 [Mycobacterium phage LittleE]|uniref:Uncharacterized protein n=1 Tax=Mycobacterium phage LittleE TaxID=2922212 RepID=G1D447_9CAUD|nr:hypothetical protein FGG27_gp162 [Mycobacterium phage LittleE]AEK09542.1 hypothetical protein LITTLEE_162 [Mycobacterium phage LittleE]